MNWKRGLFRTWLALAVLWGACWVFLSWSSLSASFRDFACLVGEGTSGPWCEYRRKGFIIDGGFEDRRFWVDLVVPPLALLLLGYILFWIGRGFRRQG